MFFFLTENRGPVPSGRGVDIRRPLYAQRRKHLQNNHKVHLRDPSRRLREGWQQNVSYHRLKPKEKNLNIQNF